jgi:hypothetical protein
VNCLNIDGVAIDHTFKSKVTGSTSCIDHFLLTENLLSSFVSAGVSHDIDNFSDHDPLYLCTSLSANVTPNEQVNNVHTRIAWHSASSIQIARYKTTLNEMLADVNLPSCTADCIDVFCTAHQQSISKFHDDIIECCTSSALSSIGRPTAVQGSGTRPGWSRYVKPVRVEALKWHRAWKERGRPDHGPLYDMRKMTRARYHNAVRFIKKQEQILRDTSLANSMSDLDYNQFWREVKRIKDSRKPVASTVDDFNTRAEICKVFTDKYSALYNSVTFDSSDMIRYLDNINRDLLHDSTASYLYISTADVKKAVSGLKTGKSDGQNQQSDHLINGTPLLFRKLAQLFTAMINLGFAPDSFLLGTLSPIVKNGRKSINSSSNYRGITLSSILGKILDRIIMNRFSGSLYSNDFQFGFKQSHSTVQCTLVIDEVSKYYTSNGGEIYIMLLDASQAFDRVNYVKLFRALSAKGMCPLICRFLAYSYTQQKVRVKWSDHTSEPFEVTNGVKQGGVLSPTLFNVYVDFVFKKLKEKRLGCHLNGHYISCADDLTLLAPTKHALQVMLQEVNTVARDLDIKFNGVKSQLVAFNKQGHIPTTISCMGAIVHSVDNAIHLGNSVGINSDCIRVKKCIRDMVMHCNSLCTLFPCVDIEVKHRLFKTYCMPLYGCQLWH